MKIFNYLICILFLVITFSCKKDKPESNTSITINKSEDGVYITNEGNFQFANSEISYYSPNDCTVVQDIYKPINNNFIGDVCQSLTIYGNYIYAVVNNSGKIAVINKENHKLFTEIRGFTSPRYLLPISKAKAYVSDLYANKIAVINLNSNSISGYIECNGWTEKMLMLYGKVFVTNKKSEYLYIINSENDLITDSINIGFGSNSLVEDYNGKLWVLTSGNDTITPQLHKINPINLKIEKTIDFNQSDSPTNLCINQNNNELLLLNKDIIKVKLNNDEASVSTFITLQNFNTYSLGVNPKNGDIYVSDAIDYVQKGSILRYNKNGINIDVFKAGIIPNNFYFE
jgi:DNA-binding beta-propeller fold protein YncE